MSTFKDIIGGETNTPEEVYSLYGWLEDANFENAEVNIKNPLHLIWYNGTWKEGEWKNGSWVRGIWEDGVWEDGVWYSGTWKDGVWEKGMWLSKTQPSPATPNVTVKGSTTIEQLESRLESLEQLYEELISHKG